MSNQKNSCFYFGLLVLVSTVAVNGHLNLFLNQHEVMRLLGKWWSLPSPVNFREQIFPQSNPCAPSLPVNTENRIYFWFHFVRGTIMRLVLWKYADFYFRFSSTFDKSHIVLPCPPCLHNLKKQTKRQRHVNDSGARNNREPLIVWKCLCF